MRNFCDLVRLYTEGRGQCLLFPAYASEGFTSLEAAQLYEKQVEMDLAASTRTAKQTLKSLFPQSPFQADLLPRHQQAM